MPAYCPDPLTVELLSQGEEQPCRVRMKLADGSGGEGQLNFDALSAQVRALQTSWSAAPQDTGRALFQALFPGELAGQFSGALAAARDRGLRLILQIDPALPGLHRLPWERLYYPAGGQWLPLAASPRIFLSRYLQTGQPWGLPLPVGPLRVLAVISSPFPPDSSLYVDPEVEEQAVRQVFKEYSSAVSLDVIKGKISAQQIASQLAQAPGYDVLHYVGHGEWRSEEESGYLILSKRYDDGSYGPAGVSAAELVQLFSAAAHLPQLIYLSACESGQQSSHDAFSGVGPQLVRAGCPAVVCMQEKVEMPVARQFSKDFYAHLLENGVPELAVNRARTGLLEHQYLQWAVPVLFTHLADGVLFNPRQRRQAGTREPYKFLSSYQREDADLFKGRARWAAEALGRIQTSAVTVLTGTAGVGLTSLLEAGLRPTLEADQWMVLRVAAYPDLAGECRKSMEVDGRPMILPVRGDAPLSDVLRAVNPARFPHLLLALDQFEEAFLQPEAEQRAMLTALENAQQVLGDRLRLLILVHRDALPGPLIFQHLLMKRSGDWIELPPLKMEEAVSAIVDPLAALGWPVTLNPALARRQIVPDLNELYPDPEERVAFMDGEVCVDPGQLQIACTWLYQKARFRSPPLIDEDLYVKEAGGAEGILVRYMEEELRTRFAGQSELARQILTALAAPDMERWSTAEQVVSRAVFPSKQAAAAEAVTPLMDQMVKAELLIRRLVNGRYVYAFANQKIADEAYRLGGEQAEYVYNAADELERAWRLWLARQTLAGEHGRADEALATRQQLRLLAQFGQHLEPKPVKLLLLLRSAVAHNETAALWLERLRAEERDSGLLRALEGIQREGEPVNASSAALEKAARLLGMKAAGLAAKTAESAVYGEITHTAVHGVDSVDRRTAVLALSTLPISPGELYARLENGLSSLKSGFERFMRRSELFGTLAENDQLPPDANRRPWGERLGVSIWRGGRRIFLDRSRILWMGWGGGIGAGLALGIERLIVGSLAQSHIGTIFFALFSYWGLFLAGLTSLGMALAAALLTAKTRHGWALVLLAGMIGFGFSNMLVALLNGLSLAEAPLVIPMGFAAGLGLSAAYLLAEKYGWRLAAGAGAAALTFALVQAVFTADPALGSGISISLSAAYYQVEFEYFSWPFWQNWVQSGGAWAGTLALAEAGLMGAALALGGSIGRRLAARWQARWQEYLDRSGH